MPFLFYCFFSKVHQFKYNSKAFLNKASQFQDWVNCAPAAQGSKWFRFKHLFVFEFRLDFKFGPCLQFFKMKNTRLIVNVDDFDFKTWFWRFLRIFVILFSYFSLQTRVVSLHFLQMFLAAC